MSETRCHARIDEITQRVIRGMTANGTGNIAAWLNGVRSGGTCSEDLGLREVVRLATGLGSAPSQDHLVLLYLASREVYMFWYGHCHEGFLARSLAHNWRTATKDVRESTPANGYLVVLHVDSSAQGLDAITPWPDATDKEFMDLYEVLTTVCEYRNRCDVSKVTRYRLRAIHTALPVFEIGNDFIRERRGREERLPLYVHKEIHHPTNGALRETAAYQHDKRIVLSKMNVLVAENDLETVGGRRQRREEAGTKSKIPDENHGSSRGFSETKL